MWTISSLQGTTLMNNMENTGMTKYQLLKSEISVEGSEIKKKSIKIKTKKGQYYKSYNSIRYCYTPH